MGGGGYGPAFERDPERVLTDVLRGHVSVDAAASLYGVVLAEGADGMQIDAIATAAARELARHRRSTEGVPQ